MYHYNGERSQLLDSFCAYQERNNPKDDNDPDHWDMALYVSGYVILKIDFKTLIIYFVVSTSLLMKTEGRVVSQWD